MQNLQILFPTMVITPGPIVSSLVLVFSAIICYVLTTRTRRTKAIAAREKTPFFKLLIEIRLKIYRHLLCSPSAIQDLASLVLQTDNFSAQIIPPPPIDATILRVCHQVYAEALLILYGENMFRFMTLPGLAIFRKRGLHTQKARRTLGMSFPQTTC